MNKKFFGILGVLVATFAIIAFGAYFIDPKLQFPLDPASIPVRFLFVGIGMMFASGVYFAFKDNAAWEVGGGKILWMALGATLYAVFSWLFNGTVFTIPSVSQVSLRPAIVVPIYFGFTFGPLVGFFTGAVGNLFGDALTGFGLSPQWSVGNGLVGFIAGMWTLFKDKRKAADAVFYFSGVIAAVITVMFLLNREVTNQLYFAETQPVSLFAGLTVLIGWALVFAVRYYFKDDERIVIATTWGMLGNLIGLVFAAKADIFINGYTTVGALVGEFLPAAGPNLIFAAVLTPILMIAYESINAQE